ncbi:MAG: nucleotidyltransferase family protein [Desulfobacterales bacterium]|nr:nucleotidyltransferase family protein [Desulfobacterales bacterium]
MKVFFDRCRVCFHVNAHWNVIFTEKLLNLPNLFEAHGIPALPFKGPVLAQTVYGDLSRRQFVDLDILVQRRNVLKAKDLLISHRYWPLTHVNGVREADYVQLHIHYDFVDPDDKALVELHCLRKSV